MRKIVVIVSLVFFLGGGLVLTRSVFVKGDSPANGQIADTDLIEEAEAQTVIDEGLALTTDSDEPITFSTGSLPVEITKKEASPRDDLRYVVDNAERCGSTAPRPKTYFTDLARTFAPTTKLVYTITDTTSAGTLTITALPNGAGYKDLHSFQEDFFDCDREALQPVQLTSAWLVFVSQCAPEDQRCLEFAQKVVPTIKIKHGEPPLW